MDRIEPLEVEISPVHRDHRVLFLRHDVEDVDVVDLAGGQADEGRDGSPQVQQRVDLDGCLGLPEGGPREKRQV